MLKEDIRYADGCVFEGMTSISAVLNSSCSDRKILKLYYDAERLAKNPRLVSFLSRKANERGFELIKCEAETLDKMTVGSSHGGVAALCTGRTIPTLTDENIIKNGFYVFIEGIEDPYNFGYAIRSLYAAGVTGIVLSARNWMSAAGVVCRSSAGASELMNIYTAGEGMINGFHNAGYSVYCADTENAVSVYDTACKLPLLLIVGGEKRGISRELLSQADNIIKIDYMRNFDASLSAASAASVLAFEIMRQNR